MKKNIVLTGIKPTGMPHVGNYLGAIRPALELAEQPENESRFFIADYHSLNSIHDSQTMKQYTREVAAAWLAAGLDPDKTLMYRQSDVPQTFELTTVLMCFTAKGLMNRAHAYKAAVAVNREKGKPEDHQINMGLYTYPVLMAADILLFDTDLVPVGKDQVQHVEMAADMAQVVNSTFGNDVLVVPGARTSDHVMYVPGLDGRKMSKSYGNHVPLFLPEKNLRSLIMKIKTNSQGVDEPKNPDDCTIFALYTLFADKEGQRSLADRYRKGGMGWGEAKQILFEAVNSTLLPLRETYEALMADPDHIDRVLAKGAEKAVTLAEVTMQRVRRAVGVG